MSFTYIDKIETGDCDNIRQITRELSSSSFPATESHSFNVKEGAFTHVSCGTHIESTQNGTWLKGHLGDHCNNCFRKGAAK